jgi:hypothetical protein
LYFNYQVSLPFIETGPTFPSEATYGKGHVFQVSCSMQKEDCRGKGKDQTGTSLRRSIQDAHLSACELLLYSSVGSRGMYPGPSGMSILVTLPLAASRQILSRPPPCSDSFAATQGAQGFTSRARLGLQRYNFESLLSHRSSTAMSLLLPF